MWTCVSNQTGFERFQELSKMAMQGKMLLEEVKWWQTWIGESRGVHVLEKEV